MMTDWNKVENEFTACNLLIKGVVAVSCGETRLNTEFRLGVRVYSDEELQRKE